MFYLDHDLPGPQGTRRVTSSKQGLVSESYSARSPGSREVGPARLPRGRQGSRVRRLPIPGPKAHAGDVFTMQCEVCQNAVATVHLTDVSNNMKKEIHLCEECAKKRGTTIKSHMNKEPNYPEFKTAHLVAGEFSESGSEETDGVCPNCGISYSKFRSTGKFGCPEDYKIFGQHVIQLLEKIHHKVQHVGKSPKQAEDRDDDALRSEVDELRDELNNAIVLEQYEKAAAIRDKIYGLEGRIASPD